MVIRNVVLSAVLAASCSCSPGFPAPPPQVLAQQADSGSSSDGLSAQQAWENRVRDRIPCEGGEARTAWPSKEVEFVCPRRTLSKSGVGLTIGAAPSSCQPVGWTCGLPAVKEVVE